ncbi:MAG TPA: carboxypeptidase regulatory-like domain-containing protein, partial [Candidatus Eisenbacteria bacterium]|nr:carboxypeptidase regulatory-like domain-containing protein [Candidatus Eisenbacteria bacterium]
MNRYLLLLPVFLALALSAGVPPVSAEEVQLVAGHVLDARTGEPLPDALVRVRSGDATYRSVSGADGSFAVKGTPPREGPFTLEISLLGYKPFRGDYSVPITDDVRLQPEELPGPSIEVTTTRPDERGSAVAFTRLDREAVKEKYWAQDVPMLLAETPGVFAYSDAGNGIGYSYVKVRGFSQRRVAVTINGIPLNDPQSHE